MAVSLRAAATPEGGRGSQLQGRTSDALVDGPPGNKFIAYFALNNRYHHRNLPQRNSHYNIAFDGVKWMINDRVIWNGI